MKGGKKGRREGALIQKKARREDAAWQGEGEERTRQSPWKKQTHSSLLPPSISDYSSRSLFTHQVLIILEKKCVCVCVCVWEWPKGKTCKMRNPQKATFSKEKGLIQSRASAASICPLSSLLSVRLSLSLPAARLSAFTLLLTVLLWWGRRNRVSQTPPVPNPLAALWSHLKDLCVCMHVCSKSTWVEAKSMNQPISS